MGCQQSKVADDTRGVGNGQKAAAAAGGGGRGGAGGGGGGVGGGGGGRNGEAPLGCPAPNVPRCSLTMEPEIMLKINPKSPLDGRQIFKLKQSWKGIRRHMDDTGIEMFVRLFKSNGELKYMFHDFKDLTSDDQMRSNEALENHATLVMTTLDDAITHIDNYDYVTEVLRKTGASHVRFEGFSSDNFWNIREPFLDAVRLTLGDRYTDNMQTIYQVAINFILRCMAEGMEEGLKAKAQDNS